MRVSLSIHVRPNASSTRVGGAHDGALVVHVAEPPERGRATAAALGALAEALAVPPSSVRLVRGGASKRKVVALEVDEADAARLEARVEALRGASSPGAAGG